MGCGVSKNTLPVTNKPLTDRRLTENGKHGLNAGLDTCSSNSSTVTSASWEACALDKDAKKITIIHFNDVYNIEPGEEEPVGGAARFITKAREYGQEQPLVLFSGDCLNPSLSKFLRLFLVP